MIVILYFIGQVFLIPHIVLFEMSKNKALIIKDLYSGKKTQKKGLKLWYDLTFELLTNKYFRTLFYFRIQNIASKIIRIFYPKERSFIIEVNTRIGGGVILAHPYATIIHANAIGNNLYINHLVTIGEKNGKKPTIGANVTIHCNAIIIGGIHIGDNVVIGAGAVVLNDVPSNYMVVGNPGRNIPLNSNPL